MDQIEKIMPYFMWLCMGIFVAMLAYLGVKTHFEIIDFRIDQNVKKECLK